MRISIVASAVIVAALALSGQASGATLVKSKFTNSAEGWTVTGDASSGPTPLHFTEGGNPGGFIRAVDAATGNTLYWNSPEKFGGDRTAALGGSLTYDIRISAASALFADEEVFLYGGDRILMHDIADTGLTANAWRSFRVPLKASAWVDTTASPEPATKRDMERTLGELSTIVIRAEYQTGDENDDLDNVLLKTPRTS